MLSPRLLSLVEDCGVVERGDNLSGHSPIWVKLRLGALPIRKGMAEWVPRKPLWSKASQENIAEYAHLLENKMLGISLPLLELGCEDPLCQDKTHCEKRDHFVLDILMALVESSYTTLPLSVGGGGGGRNGRGKGKPIPGWEEVKPIRKEARYWHDGEMEEEVPLCGQKSKM